MWSNYEHSDFKAHQETPLEGNPALKDTLMAQTLKAQEAIPKFKLFPKDCWHEPGFVFHLDWQVKVPPSRASLWHIPRLGFEQGLGTGMKEKLLLDKFRDEHSPLQKRNTDPCFSPKIRAVPGKAQRHFLVAMAQSRRFGWEPGVFLKCLQKYEDKIPLMSVAGAPLMSSDTRGRRKQQSCTTQTTRKQQELVVNPTHSTPNLNPRGLIRRSPWWDCNKS